MVGGIEAFDVADCGLPLLLRELGVGRGYSAKEMSGSVEGPGSDSGGRGQRRLGLAGRLPRVVEAAVLKGEVWPVELVGF